MVTFSLEHFNGPPTILIYSQGHDDETSACLLGWGIVECVWLWVVLNVYGQRRAKVKFDILDVLVTI